jgi:hypothetical protein
VLRVAQNTMEEQMVTLPLFLQSVQSQNTCGLGLALNSPHESLPVTSRDA